MARKHTQVQLVAGGPSRGSALRLRKEHAIFSSGPARSCRNGQFRDWLRWYLPENAGRNRRPPKSPRPIARLPSVWTEIGSLGTTQTFRCFIIHQVHLAGAADGLEEVWSFWDVFCAVICLCNWLYVEMASLMDTFLSLLLALFALFTFVNGK